MGLLHQVWAVTYELISSDLLNYVQYWCFRVGLNWMNGWVSRGDDDGGGWRGDKLPCSGKYVWKRS